MTLFVRAGLVDLEVISPLQTKNLSKFVRGSGKNNFTIGIVNCCNLLGDAV